MPAPLPVDLLAAPFYYRLLVSGEPIDEAFGRSVADAVFAYVTSGVSGRAPHLDNDEGASGRR